MLFRFYGAIVAAALAFAGLAQAAEPLVAAKDIPGSFSANVALTSEYYFRGLSQTDDAPAIQGGFDYGVDFNKSVGAYVGVWGSNVDFNEGGDTDGATVEIDLYGGLAGAVGNFGWDVGFIYYTYPGAASSLEYDFVEVQGALSYDFGIASTSISLNYSPENFGDSGEAWYTKIAVDVPVGKKVDLSVYVARQEFEKEDVFGQPDYWEWNFSGTVNLAGFDLTLAYSSVDIPGDSDGAEDAVLFTVARSF